MTGSDRLPDHDHAGQEPFNASIDWTCVFNERAGGLMVVMSVELLDGHDGPGRSRSIRPPFRSDAAAFLGSEWAERLADLIGLSAPTIWIEARRLCGRRACAPAPDAA